MEISVQESLNNLRSHYRMVGLAVLPIPVPQPFELAFAESVAVHDIEIFKYLPPLLVVNEWNVQKLVAATPEHFYGRLKFLCDVAEFFMNFSRRSMKVPITGDPVVLRKHLEELGLLLQGHKMENDIITFDKDIVYPWTGSFFVAHGLDGINWELNTFWKCYGETIKLIKQKLTPPEPFDPFNL